jgi:hypothetical protein
MKLKYLKEVSIMKKATCLFITFVMLLSFCTIPAFAAVPVDDSNLMYANDVEPGAAVTVLTSSADRLHPENALGMFDAVQSEGTSANSKFYAVASHEWTNYTFEDKFWNVDGEPDIEFCEVTWGSIWHPEAVMVYLTDAYVLDVNGDVVPYEPIDDGFGYFAGLAWNKIGINDVSAARRSEITLQYFDGDRDFEANTFGQNGNFGFTRFYLPNEVVYASGITLVDVTKNVYAEDGAAGAKTYIGATDGYDLDAIRVYKYTPGGSDSATGFGDAILTKGTWFMYNTFTGDKQTYEIQAGNPKDGVNTIGTYSVEKNTDGSYTVTYDVDDTIIMNGYEYDIVVTEGHLVISDDVFTSANPGKMDNQDFGVPFADADGTFNIFAHFTVEYK